jgi:5-methylcytosine-specific restriction endonuclease McrA
MTLSKAESILGYGVDLEPPKGEGLPWVVACNWEQGTERVTGNTRDRALELLVEWVYRLRCEAVRKRDGYRCTNCGRLGPTEIDHIIPRSRGRSDLMTNLRSICSDCHRRKHG